MTESEARQLRIGDVVYHEAPLGRVTLGDVRAVGEDRVAILWRAGTVWVRSFGALGDVRRALEEVQR